ncbi:hypothetical protein [Streptomyces sp. NPDC057381]|uniref:hypothetical protein n=1 Tax=Streptomyces sp. NPDC057381 TaxID=3346111 RepID=UPI0036453623
MARIETAGRPTTAEQTFPLAGEQTPSWYAERPTNQLSDLDEAERLLRSTPPLAAARDHFRAARLLLHVGKPHQVVLRCAELRDHAGNPAWTKAFGALHAEALLHLGDLPSAEHEATAAMNTGGHQCAVLGPWATALLAESLVEQNRLEEAATHLGGLLGSTELDGLPSLRVHGRLLMALDRPSDALTAFTRVARLARQHTTGLLPHLPWRSDMAEALLRLGRTDQAHALLTEELGSPAPGPRERGVALRFLSTTEEPERRLPLLSQAATELRRSDGRVELARVLRDFAHTLSTLGELSTAEVFRHRAAGLLPA